MSRLDKFQKDASLALNDPALQSPNTVVGRDEKGTSRRFNIYRNNRAGSLIDALQGTYPVLYRLLGEEFFRAAARQFIDKTPPNNPVLSEYGKGFGDFVQALPGTSEFPYLADIAILEWQRLQSYHAINDPVLTLNGLQSIEPAKLIAYKLEPHAAMALIESNWAIGSVWASSHTGEKAHFNLTQGERVLITRPVLDVQVQLLDADGALFLQHLCQSITIEEAATGCLASNPAFDTGIHLQGLITMGAFSTIFN